MQTRNQLKRHKQSASTVNDDGGTPSTLVDESGLSGKLADISRKGVNKLLKRTNPRGTLDAGLLKKDKQCISKRVLSNNLDAEIGGGNAETTDAVRENAGAMPRQNFMDHKESNDESVWEDGSIPILDSPQNYHVDEGSGVTVEFDAPDSAKKKHIRRATAEDKDIAELVHKVHLLCLLARGRLIDTACNDPLIQAAMLSLLPPHLLKISEMTKLTANALAPLVSWFHNNFHVRGALGSVEKPFHSALALALETHGGSPEEVVALSVALFRALNLTTRFVSVMDVASLKPEVDCAGPSYMDVRRESKGIFESSTLMVDKTNLEATCVAKSLFHGKNLHEMSLKNESEILLESSSRNTKVENFVMNDELKVSDPSPSATENVSYVAKRSQRKGDLEFEMQLEMALSSTAVAVSQRDPNPDVDNLTSSPSNFSSPLKRLRESTGQSSSSSQVISTAIGSKKVGAPLYWAEVYCNGENMTGKWVHVDAVNAITDGEQKVEAAAAACKKSLRYVVAFAGHGAKDVTRRYCTKWYRISPQRVDSVWWDAVITPLKELEARATGGMINLSQREVNVQNAIERVDSEESDHGTQAYVAYESRSSGILDANMDKDRANKIQAGSSIHSSPVLCRTALEDMELATRALTEPLPSNQQAYRNHPLYAIEKWLTKYQILHPKGPVLGFCSGHPVYLRTCVQALHTKDRWLREGLQVKAGELPAKVAKSRFKHQKGQVDELEESGEGESRGTIALYGKWQTEPLCIPPAVDGIVPKNERGQVDVWSEKCLPPGTVHLRLPRLVPVAKRLEIDFAPAMVGFEFRNGRSLPVYEGIVVCAEFKDAILEAYAEEEDRREKEERKRDERQAISRWYQLLSSIVTRQRLNDTYRKDLSSQTGPDPAKSHDIPPRSATPVKNENRSRRPSVQETRNDVTTMNLENDEHEHVFVMVDDEGSDGESMVRTRRCHCGFSVQVEEL